MCTFCFATGYVLCSVYGYYFLYWRDLLKALGWSAIIPTGFLLFFNESPRYLVMKGKIKEATENLNYIADKNDPYDETNSSETRKNEIQTLLQTYHQSLSPH